MKKEILHIVIQESKPRIFDISNFLEETKTDNLLGVTNIDESPTLLYLVTSNCIESAILNFFLLSTLYSEIHLYSICNMK